MDWIRVDAALPTHPKSLDLADILGEELAWARMVKVWGWAATYSPDGRVRGRNPARQVEMAAGWTGEPGRFAKAAVEAGFLLEEGGDLLINQWEEHNGKALRRAKKAADRSRAWREQVQDEREKARDAAYANRTHTRTHTERIPNANETHTVCVPYVERDETRRDVKAEEINTHTRAHGSFDDDVDEAVNDNVGLEEKATTPPAATVTPLPVAAQARPVPPKPAVVVPTAKHNVSIRQVREVWEEALSQPGVALVAWPNELPNDTEAEWDGMANLRPLDGPAGWRTLIGRMANSDHCNGRSGQRWLASPFWLFDKKNWKLNQSKALGGVFSNGTGPPAKTKQRDWAKGHIGADEIDPKSYGNDGANLPPLTAEQLAEINAIGRSGGSP